MTKELQPFGEDLRRKFKETKDYILKVWRSSLVILPGLGGIDPSQAG